LTAASLAGNGYQRFANGYTIQWGGNTISANTRTTYSYPTSFSTVYSIASGSDWGPTGSGGWAVAGCTLNGASTFIGWNAGDGANTVYYIATGVI
jgi:hypothetical protein